MKTTWILCCVLISATDCFGKKCPALQIENAANNPACPETDYMVECLVACDAYHKLEGGASVRCHKSGFWNAMPKCKSWKCPPLRIANAANDPACPETDSTQRCTVTCDANHELEGEDSVFCIADTVWGQPPKCIPKSWKCPPLRIANAANDPACPETDSNGDCLVTCDAEHELEGVASVQCVANGVWSPTPKCIPKSRTCPPLRIANAATDPACPETNSNGDCLVTCDAYHELEGESSVHCVANGVWSPTPKCIPKSWKCPPLEIANAANDPACPETDSNQRCTVTCDANHELEGEDSVFCFADAVWDQPPKCIPKSRTCPPLRIANAANDPACPETEPNGECSVTCDAEHELEGDASVHCFANGVWSPTPRCIPKSWKCPPLQIANAANDPACPETDSNQRCTVTCDANHELEGEDSVFCFADAVWGQPPKCIPIVTEIYILSGTTESPTCPPLRIPNANNDPACPETDSNGDCLVTCDADHEPEKEAYVHCSADAVWGPTPKCIPKSCPVLQIDNAANVPACPETKSNQSCTVTCDDYHELEGGASVHCFTNGTWYPTPKCIPMKNKLSKDNWLVKVISGQTSTNIVNCNNCVIVNK